MKLLEITIEDNNGLQFSPLKAAENWWRLAVMDAADGFNYMAAQDKLMAISNLQLLIDEIKRR